LFPKCIEGIQGKYKQWRGVWKSGVTKWLSLAQLKVGMDEHATLNVPKRQQRVIDGTSCHPLTLPTLNDLLQ
jgi:hypothetical protein